MALQTIWQEKFEVRSHDTDFMLRWKPAALLRIMEEVTVHHSFHLGVDYYNLQKINLAWVLVRTKVHFHQFPPVGTRIIAETWPRGWQQKIFGMRDYNITNEQGETLAQATTAWLLVNTQTRHFVKPDTLSIRLPDNDGRFILDETLGKLARPNGSGLEHTFQANYSSLDLMGHVNNTQYLDWLCDCFPIDFWHEHQLDWLQINYNNEVKPEEHVSIELIEHQDQPGVYSAVGNNVDNELVAFEAQMGFKNKRLTGNGQPLS